MSYPHSSPLVVPHLMMAMMSTATAVAVVVDTTITTRAGRLTARLVRHGLSTPKHTSYQVHVVRFHMYHYQCLVTHT